LGIKGDGTEKIIALATYPIDIGKHWDSRRLKEILSVQILSDRTTGI
jgi:hypothetical protein